MLCGQGGEGARLEGRDGNSRDGEGYGALAVRESALSFLVVHLVGLPPLDLAQLNPNGYSSGSRKEVEAGETTEA